ncbi:hypothetical protein GWI33_009360 [Rhynchophorus ferrugineus]|uniref:Uncharacterized protein n=1 Tax=Rhynchophorus ferrugineus TaxID=354439 RepID=A0A834J262_RHYFE|nr:hypothetical protein GWI33_009360 [Rhynchophorus ferrugineus]
MANPSDSESKSDESIPLEDLHPYLTRDHGGADPVKVQRKKDKILFKKTLEVIPEKPTIISAKITPSVGTRIDLQHTPYPKDEKPQPTPKYVVPKTKKQKRLMEQNRPYTYKKFCKYGTTSMAEPIPSKKVNAKFDLPSPEVSKAKVTPRRVTPTSSWLYPDPPTRDELKLKKPKSGIIINPKEKQQQIYDYDSFDLVYKRKPRPSSEGLRKRSSPEKGDGPRKKKGKKRKKGKTKETKEDDLSPEENFIKLLEKEIENDILLGQYGEGDTGPRDYLTKQFRRKVAMISQSTSYQIKDFEVKREPSITLLANNKYAQKFRRESEIKRYQPKKRKFRRGTLESHSFTNIYQPVLKQFYFGCRLGTMHHGDEHLPKDAKKMQGICIPAAAYCYSFLKHPDRWLTEDIDEILDVGSKLYLSSLGHIHVHRYGKDLMPEDLDKYCVIDTNILIWKDKHFYFFDGKPRTKDLYYSANGTALMANFYDITAVVTVLLQRSGLQNWPFVIYPIKVFKVMGKDEEDDEIKDLERNARSNYDILNENKAVLLGSYDLGDKCFGFTRSKQSLPMVVVCLVYSRITPPSAWHKQTVDKIMIIGNQLYIECMKCESITELDLNSIPAFFTIGPYIVEIYIYSNRVVDVLYEKCCCQLECCLEDFFKTNTNAIIQFGSVHLAVWTQRKMLFCFDPYSRGADGYTCRDGYACVSMHSNMESLIDLITHNFDNKNTVFKIHALKVCKIHRDPAQSARFPKHIPLEEFPVDEFKSFKMKKSKKPATEKPVTVDYSALAMKSLLVGETPEPSIFEIGSTVESLCMEQIPPLLRPDRIPPKDMSLIKSKPINRDVIADLDSPSLSDTQIPPSRIIQPKEEEQSKFMDLDSFDLTQMEIELEEMFAEEGKDAPEGVDKVATMKDKIMKGTKRQIGEEGEEMGEEDYYYTEDEYIQVRADSLLPVAISEEINTELTYFPIKKDILYPTYVRGKQKMKSRVRSFRNDDFWDELFVPTAPEVTKSEELKKETNFVDLPDDTQIIRCTKNIAALGKDTEFIAPFVCVMANVVSKKYSILSWNTDIVDYVLKCGVELYKASKFRYDQVSKLEIPQISLGKMKYTCLVEYVFDSYTRQNILELAIDKILFVRSDMGVLVTPTYACALIYKNHLYYMYDPFGNNEVGLNDSLSNNGTACFSRFKDVHSLATRIMYNKQKRENDEEVVYTRFVLSSVKVKRIQPQSMLDARKWEEMDGEGELVDEDPYEFEESEEDSSGKKEKKAEAENKVGYHYKNGLYVIEGTRAIECEGGSKDEKQQRIGAAELNQDHFSCICACLMLLSCPIEKWDTKKVDEILDHGAHVYSHADDVDVSEKRTIKNILIQKNFFDIIVKKIKIENWKNNKHLSQGIDTLIRKKMSYFLVQFPDKCFVVHKSSQDKMFHIFYACGLPKGKKNKSNKKDDEEEGEEEEEDEEEKEQKGSVAGWLRCRNIKGVKKRLRRAVRRGIESYDFYTFEVTSIRKAPKDMLINYRLNQYELAKKRKSENFGKPFFEDIEWLKTDPIPWSRIVNKTVSGEKRGDIGNMWHNWDIEIDKDLYSLTGNIHQDCERFPQESRGKQTLCNLVTCIGMLMIYDFTEWNAAVIDSILVNGDQYFRECIKDIKDEDYELSMDDLKADCGIFPFSFTVKFKPIVEGTMFLVRSTQFNLYKALRFFFENYDKRTGIICCTKSNNNKKQVAFGKTTRREYFAFEADAHGAPMFLEGMEKAYVLRATSLNRLLHVLTMILRGGDFYIYEVSVSDLKPIS